MSTITYQVHKMIPPKIWAAVMADANALIRGLNARLSVAFNTHLPPEISSDIIRVGPGHPYGSRAEYAAITRRPMPGSSIVEFYDDDSGYAVLGILGILAKRARGMIHLTSDSFEPTMIARILRASSTALGRRIYPPVDKWNGRHPSPYVVNSVDDEFDPDAEEGSEDDNGDGEGEGDDLPS